MHTALYGATQDIELRGKQWKGGGADEDYGDDDASNNLICNTFIKYVLYIFFVNSAITLIWTIWMSTLKVCKTCHPLRFVSWAPESGHSSILSKKEIIVYEQASKPRSYASLKIRYRPTGVKFRATSVAEKALTCRI